MKCVNERLINIESDVDELQWRSMTNNIVISGIKQEPNEDTENIVRDFIRKNLGIGENVNFVSVHRFGKQRQNIQRIMTKFVSLKDKQLVMRNCHKLKGTHISVREQFPVKIEKKRKKLYPILKQAKKDRKKAILIRDKLFIEGELYEPSDDSEPIHTDNKETKNRNTQNIDADKSPFINSTQPSDFYPWNRPILQQRKNQKRNRIDSDEPYSFVQRHVVVIVENISECTSLTHKYEWSVSLKSIILGVYFIILNTSGANNKIINFYWIGFRKKRRKLNRRRRGGVVEQLTNQ
ncbi:unnamed protein product [Mytilus edulis]|uniref:Uncharacterized protein n=1 Tax=Mytilus edulis TaxID=6550 RepID=A0A8S3U348_MYTED|nr:unnamed protein product [Mytilus edulis]